MSNDQKDQSDAPMPSFEHGFKGGPGLEETATAYHANSDCMSTAPPAPDRLVDKRMIMDDRCQKTMNGLLVDALYDAGQHRSWTMPILGSLVSLLGLIVIVDVWFMLGLIDALVAVFSRQP